MWDVVAAAVRIHARRWKDGPTAPRRALPAMGLVGGLPPAAWRGVADWLSSQDRYPGKTRRATVLELRRTCGALRELVGLFCVGGAGRVSIDTAHEAEQLKKAPTASLGRALVVKVSFRELRSTSARLAHTAALAVAVQRGHMVNFKDPIGFCNRLVAWTIEVALVEASREGCLEMASFNGIEQGGWSIDTVAQLSAVSLANVGHEAARRIASAGVLRRAMVHYAEWEDPAILAGLHEVLLFQCEIGDLSPLADVPKLVLFDCKGLETLPALRNDWLEVDGCYSLTDLSGLSGGRVRYLRLNLVIFLEDLSPIAAMRPPPHTVVLISLKVRDVSMLTGVHRLDVAGCRDISKDSLDALRGKVPTLICRRLP